MINVTPTTMAVKSNTVARQRLNFPRLIFPFNNSFFAYNKTKVLHLLQLLKFHDNHCG